MKKTVTILSLALFAMSVSAKTWVVRPSSEVGVDFTSINAALANENVADGDILDIAGTFESETAIELSKAVELKGNGPATTKLKSSGTNRVLSSYALGKSFKISGMTVEGSGQESGEAGAAIFIFQVDNVAFDNVHFKNFKSTTNGGAILVNTVKNFSFKNCEFVNNTTKAVGGAIYLTTLGGSGLFENCTFEGNAAVNNGWGNAIIFDNGSAPQDNVMLKNCTFFNNGNGLGGVIAINYSNISISVHSCTFAANSGNDNVGDLYFIPNAGNPGMLSYKANLFFDSRGIIMPNGYKGNMEVEYNVSTSVINVEEGLPNIKYDAFANLAEQLPDVDVKVELVNSLPALKDNGGKVRTIKLTGTEDDNAAIAFVGEIISETDARGYTRKADYQDAGAYESGATNALFNAKGNTEMSFFPNPAKEVINFSVPITGNITIFDLTGSLVKSFSAENASTLHIGDLNAGIYVISVTVSGQAPATARLIKK